MTISTKNKSGFTLIEILIAVGIFAILSTITIIAINPARQFAQARNTQRWTHVNTILNAIHQNMIDNSGNFDFSGCGAAAFPGSSTTTIKSSGGVDLCGCLAPTYIAEMPKDPSTGSFSSCSSYDTGYQVATTTGNRIIILAPSAELGTNIRVTR